MKKLITLIALFNVLLFPQTTKEEKLEWIKSSGDIKVTEEGNDIYKIKYPEGRTQYYYFGNTENYQTDSIPTTVIETWNVDTNLYKDKYNFWQEVPARTASGYELVIGDMNNNGYNEVYGSTRDYGEPFFQPVSVYELDSAKQFIFRYEFQEDSLLFAKEIYDIKNTGQKDLLITSTSGNAIFYTCSMTDSLAFIPDFIYARYTVNNPGQMDHPMFGDFDKNGITDMLFYDDAERGTHICEYDNAINNFEIVDQILQPIGFYAGYTIGDFDLDNKTDIVYGGIDGDVYVIEVESEHNYSIVWSTNIEGSMAYWQMSSNDIDNNGKPEFWVSSTTYNGFTDVTGFTCFEYTADNEYVETYRIDFVGVYPLYACNVFSVDVDKDGTEELVFCISDYVFIMQFRGNYVNPSYEIFYMTRNNIPGGFDGVTMYDLDKDGYEELLIYRITVRSDGKSKLCTHIYKPDFIVPVNNEIKTTILDYSLEQNYPNPFNPITTISYSLPKNTSVELKVFDILGNEVAVLYEGEKSEGRYSLQWNGKDKFQNTVSSGIYFIKLATPGFNKTIKGVMLK